MSALVKHDLMLETEDCCRCGVVFAMPRSLRSRFQQDGGTFYCPNGHSQHYTKPEIERVREMLQQANERNTRLAQEVAEARQQTAAAEATATRLRRRVQRGVCPCCNRTFQNLARHMAQKHPQTK